MEWTGKEKRKGLGETKGRENTENNCKNTTAMNECRESNPQRREG